MGSGSSIECSVCTNSSYGRCDHCRCRFCSSHFYGHSCTGAGGYGPTTVRCKPECRSCGSDAAGSCNECGKQLCSSCFNTYYQRGQCR